MSFISEYYNRFMAWLGTRTDDRETTQYKRDLLDLSERQLHVATEVESTIREALDAFYSSLSNVQEKRQILYQERELLLMEIYDHDANAVLTEKELLEQEYKLQVIEEQIPPLLEKIQVRIFKYQQRIDMLEEKLLKLRLQRVETERTAERIEESIIANADPSLLADAPVNDGELDVEQDGGISRSRRGRVALIKSLSPSHSSSRKNKNNNNNNNSQDQQEVELSEVVVTPVFYDSSSSPLSTSPSLTPPHLKKVLRNSSNSNSNDDDGTTTTRSNTSYSLLVDSNSAPPSPLIV